MFRTFFRVTAVLLLVPAIAQAQGVLVVTAPDQVVRLPRPLIIYPPRPWPPPHPLPEPPPATYKIKELEVQARLVDQVAQVQVSQTFENTGSRQLEASLVFPLPYDGAIEQMTLLIDGKEYPAKLLDAQEARKLYEQIVRKNRDPALLEWMGTGMFKTSVFPLPAGAKRTVSLRYVQLCRKQEGLTDFLFPLSTAKYTSRPVEKVSLRVAIESQEPIKNLYSPTHAIEIKRADEHHAVVSYTARNAVPQTDFRLFCDVGRGKLSTRVLSYRPEKEKEEGYFLLLASPEINAPDAERPAKTVVFVMDRSGSMSGKKIEQVRAALKDALGKLRTGDLFNIVAFDSQIEAFRPELQRFDEDTRKAALGFVEGIYAGGSTNIDGALHTALGQLQDSSRPAYVLFLTDGLPTTGETNEMKIVANATEANKVHARLFVFGVGYDVNSRLLDKLAREDFGQSDYVRPDEDIEEHISRVCQGIESPVLTGVHLEWVFDESRSDEAKPVDRVYPKEPFDLFSGAQMVVVGRYRNPGRAKVIVSGSLGGSQAKFDFPVDLVAKSGDDRNGFIEKLWAVRRVGEILDELDLKGKNKELVKELVALATTHGILTPYTSFLADENANVRDMASNLRRAEVRLRELNQAVGAGGVEQRLMKSKYQSAAQAPAASAYGGGGSSSAARGGGLSAMSGVQFAEEARKEAETAGKTVRNIGNRTFFFRGGQWVDSRLSNGQQVQAKRVKQFSDEYFELARRYGRSMSQYLVFDEPLLLSLDEQAYLIEP